jgi:hypothetical protein
VARDNMVDGQFNRMFSAVLADITIPVENFSTG